MRALLARLRGKAVLIPGNGSSARRSWAWMALVLPVLLLVTQLAACGGPSIPAASGGRTISVGAAENFWGSIAAQAGGNRVHVSNIITSPDTDPHSYEPTSGDARAFAVAQYAIVDGAAYAARAQKAIAEGSDLTAEDKATMGSQITGKQIKVLVFNSQNTTSDVNGFVSQARAGGIPIVAITETLSPAGASFQAWQVAQLQALQSALAQATGK